MKEKLKVKILKFSGSLILHQYKMIGLKISFEKYMDRFIQNDICFNEANAFLGLIKIM